MSQENVEIVRQLLGAEPRRAAAALTASVHDPDVVNGVWSLRAGKILRVDWLRSRDVALEAAGLSE